jgi:hypothetical protein
MPDLQDYLILIVGVRILQGAYGNIIKSNFPVVKRKAGKVNIN